MVIVNEGKNRIRDLVSADLSAGECGTDGTAVTAADTDLGTAVPATNASVVKSTGNKLINTSYTMLSTVGNGSLFKEYVTRFSNGDTYTRVVFPDFDKNASQELRISHTSRVI